MFCLSMSSLPKALNEWSKSAKLFTPQGNAQNAHFAPYVESDTLALNPESYVNTAMSPKNFVFAESEELFSFEGKERLWVKPADIESKLTDHIIFGVRPCDAYALAFMHKFFGDEYADVHHELRQKHLFVIAMNCTKPGEQCFCSAHGGVTGPFASLEGVAGCDISLTPDFENDVYIVHVHSAKGEQLLENIAHLVQEHNNASERRLSLLDETLPRFAKKLDFTHLRAAMRAGFSHPIWQEIAPRCIACSGCTRVCGTCTCFTTHEEHDLQGGGKRVRYWDSCQSQGFTRNAGWHNPRHWLSMVRYRIYDKLQYIEDRFDFKGCTGCGRCSATCPAAIDMANIAQTLLHAYDENSYGLTEASEPVQIPFVKPVPKYNAELYVPRKAKIIDLYDEAKSIRRFTVRLEKPETLPYADRPALRGQFYMLTDFGVGEVAISVPFSDRVEHELSFYIKKVGKVTSSLFKKQVGDVIGLRGPYGVPFPYDKFKGRSLLVIGSGVGYAPVRSPLIRAIENYKDFKHIIIIASALTYAELMLKEDFKSWQNVPNVHILYALAKPTQEVDAHVGYINDLLPGLEQDLGLNWQETSAIVCASARRIKAVAKDLLALGMQSTDIYTALETNMRCGVGKCGHCKVGPHYICVDGPVFTYADMLQMPPEF